MFEKFRPKIESIVLFEVEPYNPKRHLSTLNNVGCKIFSFYPLEGSDNKGVYEVMVDIKKVEWLKWKFKWIKSYNFK